MKLEVLWRATVSGVEGDATEREPRELQLEGRSVEVLEVLDRWLAQDVDSFKLRGSDGALYIVRYDRATEEWELTLYDPAGGGASLPSPFRRPEPRRGRQRPPARA
ncbi:MAG: hypothetical protein IT371_05400 [Deltaproteobacteria bacterium]|nr:hypothetical protein [Deltaproteobacteria bacterium]